MQGLGEAKSGVVDRHQESAVPEVGQGTEEATSLLGAGHNGQFLLLPGEDNQNLGSTLELASTLLKR